MLVLEKAKHGYCHHCDMYRECTGPVYAFSWDDLRDAGLVDEASDFAKFDDVQVWMLETGKNFYEGSCGHLGIEVMECTRYLCLECDEHYDNFAEAHQCCG